MSENMKPCPFCGSEARGVKSNGASCSNLRCVGSGCVGSIAAWNTRAPVEVVPVSGEREPTGGWCKAGADTGECAWSYCPQHRDGEPEKSGRRCPIARPAPPLSPVTPSAELIAAADALVDAAGIALGATATTQAREGLRVAIAAYDAARRSAPAKGN